MKLFGRSEDTDLFRLAFQQGEAHGRLSAEFDALKQTVAKIEAAQPAGHGLPALDADLVNAVTKLSRNDPALYRLLEGQAKELFKKGIPVERIIEQLERGAKGPRLTTEKVS